jgi:hypothetical protein
VKIFAQGLLDYLALPSAGHPAGLGERIANLGRDARSNLHVTLWGPAPSSFLGVLIGILFWHNASGNYSQLLRLWQGAKQQLHFPLANNIVFRSSR